MSVEFRHFTDYQVQVHLEHLLAQHRNAEAMRASRWLRQPPQQQPEPANFCAPVEHDEPHRFSALDSPWCHGCLALAAVLIVVASWAGWLA